MGLGLLGDLRRFFRRELQLVDDLVRPPRNPGGIIAVAEIGFHAFDIFIGKPVRDDPFEAIADFHSHLALVRRDEKDDAIVAFGIAKLPEPPQLVSVIGDIVALQIGHGRHHELPLVRFLEGVELLRQLRLGRVVDDIGFIDDGCRAAFGKGWLGGGGQGEPCRRYHDQQQPKQTIHDGASPLRADQSALLRMSSCGAASAPAVTAS